MRTRRGSLKMRSSLLKLEKPLKMRPKGIEEMRSRKK
jgi:hypothetical protein